MGRHGKQKEGISGTSKTGGIEALWHREPLSNTGSLIELKLDLITTRRKEHQLTRRRRDTKGVRERNRK